MWPFNKKQVKYKYKIDDLVKLPHWTKNGKDTTPVLNTRLSPWGDDKQELLLEIDEQFLFFKEKAHTTKLWMHESWVERIQ